MTTVASWMDRFDITAFERFVLFVLSVSSSAHGDEGVVDSFTTEGSIALLVGAPEARVRTAIEKLIAVGAVARMETRLTVGGEDFVRNGLELLGFDARWT